MIQLSVQFLVFFIFLLLLVLLFFTLYIILQRQREMYVWKRKETYLKNYSQLWYDFLIHDKPFSVTLVPRGRPEVIAIEKIFLSYLKTFTNVIIRQKIKEFSNLYLLNYYAKDLTSKRWSVKMNALYRIFDFQIDQAMDACNALETKKISKEENFQLLKINSLFYPTVFMEKISTLKLSYSESEYRRLFVLLEDNVLIRFFEDFEIWPLRIQYAVIETAAVKRSMIFIHQLEKLLKHETDEIRIRALKGLNEIGVIEDIAIYVPFVTSEIWEERLMIAKIFKYIPFSYSYSYLEQLLQDEKWWVRSQAANTIAEHAGGIEILQHFISTAKDPYAVDMAEEIVMRKQEAL